MKYTKFFLFLLISYLFVASSFTISSTSNTFESALVFNRYGERAQQAIQPDRYDQRLLERMVLDGINQVRANQGIPALVNQPSLKRAAKEQNDFIRVNRRLLHEQPSRNKRTSRDRVTLHGGSFNRIAENLMYKKFGHQTKYTNYNRSSRQVLYPSYEAAARAIVMAWVNSSDHYQNLINRKFNYVGTEISIDYLREGLYATQVFGGHGRSSCRI